MKHIEKYYIVKQAVWGTREWLGSVPFLGGALQAGHSAINGNWRQAGSDLVSPFKNFFSNPWNKYQQGNQGGQTASNGLPPQRGTAEYLTYLQNQGQNQGQNLGSRVSSAANNFFGSGNVTGMKQAQPQQPSAGRWDAQPPTPGSLHPNTQGPRVQQQAPTKPLGSGIGATGVGKGMGSAAKPWSANL